ncbi:MAG: hypothetical protein LBG60_01615, partial [Bifidobacteriaceae bacterium]|nr:hypothetical protein [Bifidobacteriaceae bacterium]
MSVNGVIGVDGGQFDGPDGAWEAPGGGFAGPEGFGPGGCPHLEGLCPCAFDGAGAGELLDLARAAGPSAEAVALLVRVGEMDEVSQPDRVRLVGLWDLLGRWCQAQAGLALAAGCVEADERGPGEG